jgi:hypothetical protein
MRYHDAKTRDTRSDSKRLTRSSKRVHLLKSNLRDISRACEDAVKKASRLKRRKHLERAAKISSFPPPQEEFVAMEEKDYDDKEALRVYRADPFQQDLKGIGYLVQEYVRIADHRTVSLKFDVSEKLMENMQKRNWSVQFGCILCDDEIQNRLHWPNKAICEVNFAQVRIMHRTPAHPLGKQGRDKPVDIRRHIQVGSNEVYFECEKESNREFLFYIRICSKLTNEQMRRKISDNEQVDMLVDCSKSNNDVEILDEAIRLSLRCPLSLKPIIIPSRSITCACTNVFDLEAFLDMSAKSLKWICPFCATPTSPKEIAIDTRVKSILDNTDHRGDIDMRIEDGTWIIVT